MRQSPWDEGVNTFGLNYVTIGSVKARWCTSSALRGIPYDNSNEHPIDRKGPTSANSTPSDAFVFFELLEDSASRLPSDAGDDRHGQLDMPIIGVGRSQWTSDQLKERARESIQEHDIFEDVLQLAARLQYVCGNYTDQTMYEGSRFLDAGQCTVASTLPRNPAEHVRYSCRRSAPSGCSKGARMIP